MDARMLRDIQRRLARLERTSVRYRAGEVTGTSPLDVALGGAGVSYKAVRALPGRAALKVGDRIAAFVWGNDVLVAGVLGGGEGGPRIVYGMVNSGGTIARGTGFSVTRNGTGDYTITFSTAFAATPVLTAMIGTTSGALAIKEHPSSVASTTAIRLLVFTTTTGAATDANFHFHAVGA